MSIVCFVLGFLSCGAGLFWQLYFKKNEKYRGHAEARVVDIVTEPRRGQASLSEFHNRQAAVFEFYAGGKPIKVKDPADTYPCPYNRNERVRINYDPDAPEQFEIEERNRWREVASVIEILGVVCIAVGCILFLMYAGRVEI